MRKLKKVVAIAAVCALALSLVACGSVDVTQIALEDIELKTGETVELAPTFAGEENADAEKLAEAAAKLELVYSVADENIATVDENGVVTAVAAGETEVTVRAGERSATAKIVVTEAVQEITAEDMQLHIGDEPLEIVFAVLPETAEVGNTELEIADETIAKIEDGKLVAVAAGETELTIKVDGVQKVVKVTVAKAPAATPTGNSGNGATGSKTQAHTQGPGTSTNQGITNQGGTPAPAPAPEPAPTPTPTPPSGNTPRPDDNVIIEGEPEHSTPPSVDGGGLEGGGL